MVRSPPSPSRWRSCENDSARIALTKLTDDRHRLAIRRDDGSSESVELETRSLLLHDLVHWAIEAEAKIDDGFWGSLAGGTTLEALSDRTATPTPGLALAESLVGPMQSLWNGRLDPAIYLENVGALAPDVVDAAFVERVCERLRALTGHWRATWFGEVMEIEWPAR